MKKEDIPQDDSALKSGKELCYAVDENGQYTTAQSIGWEIKSAALNVAWEDIQKRIQDAKVRVEKGEVSPLLFFMEYRMMNAKMVAAYTGFWRWQVKRHLKPSIFNKLSDSKLRKYAEIFEISVEELKTMTINANS